MSAFAHCYTLYGVSVRSNRAIAGLSQARPDPSSNVVTVDFAGEIGELPAAAPFLTNGMETLWHLDGERWLVQYSAPARGYVWTALHEPDAIVVRWNHDAILDDIDPILQGSAISPTLHLRGIPLLHACIVAIDDFAIAIMGAPGAGKSTTAAAFVAAGYGLVSDDIGALEFAGSTVRVHSGYPRMRLYSDSARAAGFTDAALQSVFHERLLGYKSYVELSPSAFREGPLPLRGIFMLQPRKTGSDETTITAVDSRAPVPMLMDNIYSVRFLDRRRLQKAFASCTKIASAAAIRTVRAADDLGSLSALVEAIAADASRL